MAKTSANAKNISSSNRSKWQYLSKSTFWPAMCKNIN